MKKTITILFLCFALLITFSSVCMATDSTTTTSENTAVTSDQDQASNVTTISNTNNDVYASGDEVSVVGYVNGNTFVFGKKVNVSGYINGDLFVMASSLAIENDAQINGNVFVLAQDVTISGRVNDVYSLAQNFTMSSTGLVVRNLTLSCSAASFDGKIGNNANVSAGSLTFAANAKNVIGNDLHYSSKEEANIPEGAVAGAVDFSQITVEEPTAAKIISNYITNFITVVLYAAVVIIISAFVTPKFAEKATYSMSKKSFITALIGIIAVVFIPIVSILLALTVIFAYAGISLLIVYILVLSITISILGMAIGNYFANKLKNKTKVKFILLSIASVIVLWLLQRIPFIGGYISIFTVVFGLGIFIYSLFSKKALEEVKE